MASFDRYHKRNLSSWTSTCTPHAIPVLKLDPALFKHISKQETCSKRPLKIGALLSLLVASLLPPSLLLLLLCMFGMALLIHLI
jgi:hypothetical protein